MTMENFLKIKRKAKEFFKDTEGCHGWDHTERVLNLCLKIGKQEQANLEILKLAAVLHDIGRQEEYLAKGKICHAETGAKLASQILSKYNYSKELIDNVVHCVESHRFRNANTPTSIEAKILYDADKLDSIGAVGIGRAFLFAGIVGAKLHNKNIDVAKTKEYSKDDTAYREFLVKLRHIKDKMMTKEGRRIAKERHKFMANFFDRLNKKVDGER